MSTELSPAVVRLPVPSEALTELTAWETVVDAYLDAGIDSPETRRAYARALVAAFTFLDVDSLADLHGAALARWRVTLLQADLSPASQAQALSALRSFLRWSGALGAPGRWARTGSRLMP